MIKRIDIFMPPLSRYNVLQGMTHAIYKALSHQGVNCRILVAQRDDPLPFLESIFSDPPDCTLSLNGLLPDPEGRFFCDMIKIPHVAWLVDSPNQFTAMADSKRNIILCPDKYATLFFKDLKFENVLFLPHGVDPEIASEKELEKKYDVVFLGSCIDYESIEKSWETKYPKNLYHALKQAAQTTLSDQETPYVEAFVDALNRNLSKSETLATGPLNLMQVLHELEMYIRGKDRVALLKGIKDATVDVFGAGESQGWKKYFPEESQNIRLHPPISFEEAIEVMKQSKIVLNSSPWIKNGGHERIFAGMLCGAVVITSDNPFMTHNFDNEKDLFYYYHGQWRDVNATVNLCLKDESKRKKIAQNGKKKVIASHTWSKRVESLIKELPKMLEKIQKKVEVRKRDE